MFRYHVVCMPDDPRRPRNLEQDDSPSLGVRVLMRALEELVKHHGLVEARVAYKRNAKGEYVVAILFRSFPRS